MSINALKRVEENNRTCWYLNDKLHNDDDKPAIIYKNGDKYWFKHGEIHRDGDLPAVIYDDGKQDWYQHNKLHRDGDLPARVYPNGDYYWFKNNDLHRDNDQPAIIYANGDKHWFKNGMNYVPKAIEKMVREQDCIRYYKGDKIHRDNDEPAIVCDNGDRFWYQNGKRHRDGDEPAVIYANGDKTWYKNGRIHRDGDQPACIDCDNGIRTWYKDGFIHRDGDKPAVIYPNGEQYYYRHGQLYTPTVVKASFSGKPEKRSRASRTRGPGTFGSTGSEFKEPEPVVSNGAMRWYKNGLLHRDGDKPAVMYNNGSKEWYKNGELHRGKGQPACVYSDGSKYWYKNGVSCPPTVDLKFQKGPIENCTSITHIGPVLMEKAVNSLPLSGEACKRFSGEPEKLALNFIKEKDVQIVYGTDDNSLIQPKNELVELVKDSTPEEYENILEMVKKQIEKNELVRKGSKEVLKNMSKFTPDELSKIVDKDKEQYKDISSQFALSFVKCPVDDSVVLGVLPMSKMIIGILMQIEKETLVTYYNDRCEECKNQSVKKIIHDIITSPKPYPSHNDFIKMIYKEINNCHSALKFYIISKLNREQFSDINFKHISLTDETADLYYMLRDTINERIVDQI